MNMRISIPISRGMAYPCILLLWLLISGCATENPSPVPVTGAPAERVTEIDGFLIYEKQPLDRMYDVLGYVEIERPSGQKRDRALADLKAKALAMGGNAIIDLRHVVAPRASRPSVLGGPAATDFGLFGDADLVEIIRWRGTVVRLKH